MNFLRENDTDLFVLADLAVVAIGLLLATIVADSAARWSSPDMARYLLLCVASMPVWLYAVRRNRLYVDRVDIRLIEDVRRIANALVVGAIGMVVLSWPFGIQISGWWMCLLLALTFPMLVAERQLLRVMSRRRRLRGLDLRPVAIMGTNEEARELARSLGDPVLGCRVVAFVSTDPDVPTLLDGLPVLVARDPAAAVQSFGASGVVIASTALKGPVSSSLLRSFLDRRIRVELTSALTDVEPDRMDVHTLGRHPMIALEPGFRGGWRAMAKRAFDIVVSATALLFLSPLMAVTAIAVRLDSKGPAIFSQVRAGVRGRPFTVYKFRSMVQDAEEQVHDLRERNESDGPLFKMTNDPRVTRVGHFIRTTSIDELPQLWNVLRGDMSLVGPRPALPDEVEKWGEELRARLRVRPGITGMWQVSGRSNTSFSEYQRLDLFYVDNWSILTDLSIIVRTFPAVLSREGAA